MIEKTLELLEQNFLSKRKVLDQLQGVYDKQSVLLESTSINIEIFDDCMEQQEQLLQELICLNEDADRLYERLSLEESLLDGTYDKKISYLKRVMSQLMDKTVLLQKVEQSNKQKLEEYFQNERKNLGTGRRSSKAALDYYKNMSRSNVVPPQFMDQKK